MSKDNVKHMFAKIDKDESMKKSYEQLMKSCHEEYEKIIAQRLIEFGKTKGFAFSKDDLISAQAELIDKFNENRELSDNDLSNVAGGSVVRKCELAFVSVSTFGVACAITSIVTELQRQGKCGSVMSVTTHECEIPK